MLNNLKLAPKFTLLLSGVFISAIVISGIILSQTTQQKAEGEVASQGRLLMEMMSSVRDYTSANVNPLLAPRLETEPKFIAETVPAFSATEVFKNLRQNPKYKDFFYKEAVLNPTNLSHKADDFESEIVNRFRKESKIQEISGFRNLFGKQVFYTTKAITVKKQSCLRCHSTPEVAPKSQLASYGSENGFGWKLKDIIGVQIIYVPSEEVFGIAHKYLSLVMGIFIGVFAIVILLINFLLKRAVIQPLRPMARLAHKISNEQMSSDQTVESDIESLGRVARKSDELGQLARLFNQMAQAIYGREQSFAKQLQELRIKSEQLKTRTQSNNNEISYLKALQQKAQMIRGRAKSSR